MLKFIKQSNWFTGILIFFMPVTLIIFLGSQMAYSQVKSKFEAYQNIPEITTLAELENLPAGQLVMLRGRISEATPLHNAPRDRCRSPPSRHPPRGPFFSPVFRSSP